MLNILKKEIKYLKSLKADDYMGNSNGIIDTEIDHVKNLIKLYEEA